MVFGTRRSVFGAAVVALSAGLAIAGGSGENVIIIADPLNPESMYAANYYKAARHLPDANILCFSPGATSYQSFVQFNLAALQALIEQRGLADQADYILLMPGSPFYINAPGLVNDGCSPVNRFSISGAYTTAFISDDVLGGVASTFPNRYARNVFNPQPFDSQTRWLNGSPSNDPTADRYYLGAMLGYTGERGNTLAEILANVDRSVAADYTRPVGTFYFCQTDDNARSSPRHNSFDSVVNEIVSLGGSASHEMRQLPRNDHDILSILTGYATLDIQGANMTLLAGSYCDHLTSYGATFDVASQTKISEWITKGATASMGAVEEPCNYPGKFTHARSMAYYYQGASMGESIFRALGFTPFQGLVYGDPLCRLFDYPVGVTVDNPPPGPVSGNVALTAVGSTEKPFNFVLDYEVLVDNHRVAADFQMPLTFDSATLGDGWHDLRVVGYDTSSVRSMGVWQGALVVRNKGRSAELTPHAIAGDHATDFVFDASGLGGGIGGSPVEIRLVSGGRVLAAAAGCDATLHTRGLQLGAGVSHVQAEALFADGMRVRSAPVAVTVAYDNGVPAPAAPGVFTSSAWLGAATTLVELPYTHANGADTPTFAIVDPPAHATIVPGPAGPYRLIKPDAGASGHDVMTYRVTNSSGQSALGRVVLVYDAHPLDVTGDGAFDIDDLYAINQLPVDVNLDGVANGADIRYLQAVLRCGEQREVIR
ncbi:MAG: TIGR03790 family protein [Phycisphaerales bacterium]|nr:TIGR03790 family protein [Phycisphaerales bacterium]